MNPPPPSPPHATTARSGRVCVCSLRRCRCASPLCPTVCALGRFLVLACALLPLPGGGGAHAGTAAQRCPRARVCLLTLCVCVRGVHFSPFMCFPPTRTTSSAALQRVSLLFSPLFVRASVARRSSVRVRGWLPGVSSFGVTTRRVSVSSGRTVCSARARIAACGAPSSASLPAASAHCAGWWWSVSWWRGCCCLVDDGPRLLCVQYGAPARGKRKFCCIEPPDSAGSGAVGGRPVSRHRPCSLACPPVLPAMHRLFSPLGRCRHPMSAAVKGSCCVYRVG